jgi:hypothetical protein
VFNLTVTGSATLPQFLYYQPILPHGSGALASFSYAFGSPAQTILPSQLYKYAAYAPPVSGSVRLASGNYLVDTTSTGALDIYVVNYGSAGTPNVNASGFLVQQVTAAGSVVSGSFSVPINNLNFNLSDYIGFVVNHNISAQNTTNIVIEATLFCQW